MAVDDWPAATGCCSCVQLTLTHATYKRTNLIGRRQVPGSISHIADIAYALVVRRKEDAPRACWKNMSFGSNLEHARPISGSERHAQDLQSQSSVATELAVRKCLGKTKCFSQKCWSLPHFPLVQLPEVSQSFRFVCWSVAYGVRKRRTTSHPSFDSELCSRARRPEPVWHPIATHGTHDPCPYRLQTDLNDPLNTGRVCRNKVQLPTAIRHC